MILHRTADFGYTPALGIAMGHFDLPQLVMVLAMIAYMIGHLALQVGIVVAGAWIALTLWHRHNRVSE